MSRVEAGSDTLELLWGLRAAPLRGPRAGFGVADIAAAAVSLADDEGVETVTMSRVAQLLGYTKMSLYRHVPDKEALHAVMVEAAVGEPPDLRRVRGGWRARATRWTELMWATWERHPWIAALTVGERPVGPREVGWSVAALGCFTGLGLDRSRMVQAVSLLSGHVRNTYLGAAAGTQPWTPDVAPTASLADVMARAGVAHPELDVLFAAPSGPEDGRRFGLRCILDGIEAQLPRGGVSASAGQAGGGADSSASRSRSA